jgi:sporulation protein YlmC with PRC-barrel domain
VASEDRMKELEEKYEGYKVYDNAGDRIGKVDDLFVDDAAREEYIGVKMGFFGLKSTLIPMDVVRVNEQERIVEVSESKEHVKEAPNFDDDDDITPEYEDRVRRHFGLGSLESSEERGAYGQYAGATASGAAGATPTENRAGTEDRDRGGMEDRDRMDMEDRDRVGRESYRNREDVGSGSAMESAGTAGAPTPSGGMEDLETGHRETGDQGHVADEGYREGYREGFREGYREGSHESGGLGEPGDREGSSTSGSMTGDETREMPPRSSEEGEEREEGGRTRVWQRLRR